MNISNSIPSVVTSISFSFLSAEDVRRISVKQITNPILLDTLGQPNVGGLYDPCLGPSERKNLCSTCRLGYFQCPGHFGHIELPAPVYHPLFMSTTYNLLRATCLYCHRFKVKRTVVARYAVKLRLLEHGLLDAANSVDQIQQRASTNPDDDEPTNEELYETDEEFIQRLTLFASVHLYRASSSKRDHYKDNLVYKTRKDLIAQFMRSSILKSCQNDDCNGPAYTFRKEGHTKIIEYDLTSKQKAQNSAAGRKRQEVFIYHKKSTRSEEPNDLADSGSEASSSEEGEDIAVDDEDVVMADETANLPRAANGKVKTKRGRNERVMTPEECRAHLRRLFKNDSIICSFLFGQHGRFSPLDLKGLSQISADMFFMEVIPVPPTRFRPPARMGEMLFEHPQNELLAKTLNTCYRIRDLNEELKTASLKEAIREDNGAARRKILGSLFQRLIQLQVDVNSFIDSSKNPTITRQGKLPPPGIKQILEKKEGLFRMHMMGKRVNYAARSVISPDVNIEPNEIGVPPVFARKLTFPEPVTQHNFREMRELVIRGTREYPGASMVEFEDGHLQFLDKMSLEQRTALANQLLTPQEGNKAAIMASGLTTRTMTVNKKVHRHLRDGDILILNRQPTLHKPSMMAHKARVLRGEKTIRMHYANCNSYNADFDGDEMNIHFPQNEVARAESYFIANTDNQYLVPTSGKPLRGLIQDHIVAAVWMTARSTFFTREDYHQLLYGSLRPEDELYTKERLITLPPSIFKPTALWTGKQIISTVLRNIQPENAPGLNLQRECKVPGDLWGKDAIEEGNLIIVNGDMVTGILDKSQIGASAHGLVHAVHELYGPDIAGRLLGIFGRLFTKFLQHRAFTCRMDDLVLTKEGNAKRQKLRENVTTLGVDAAVDNFPALQKLPKSEISPALRNLLEDILFDDQKMADLDRHVQRKMNGHAKAIREACMPKGLLRQFPANHMQTMTVSGAKGSSTNAELISCGLGQQSLEGRRVPVMVSGKTLPSFKAFETAPIAGGYVGSRFLTGIHPQEYYFHCMAGREGLIDTAVKTSRSGYLQRCLIKHLESIHVHYDHTVRGSDSSIYQFCYGRDSLDVTKQAYLYQFDFAVQNAETLVNKSQPKALIGRVDDEVAMAHMKKALKKPGKYPPVLSLYSPSRYLGSTSEGFAKKIDEYVKENKGKFLLSKRSEDIKPWQTKGRISQRTFRQLMNVRYMRSLVEPGEAVGLLASQGIGEPSTQMTLNTFHLAGHSAANVTMGIPRLREIIMTASTKPKTPNMILPVLSGVTDETVDDFCRQSRRLTLSQLVDKAVVKERYYSRRRRYTVNLSLYPVQEYEAEYSVTTAEVLMSFLPFSQVLKKEIQLELKRLDATKEMGSIGKGHATKDSNFAEEEENADEPVSGNNADAGSEAGDGDGEDAKRTRQTKQLATYEDDWEDDEDNVGPIGDAEIEAEYNKDDAMEDDGETDSFVAATEEDLEDVRTQFMASLKAATSFSFDGSGCTFGLEFGSDVPKLLLVGVVERACRKTVVREIPNIKDCFMIVEEGKKGRPDERKLMTNGSNYTGMWRTASTVANLDEIYSNDIHATLCTYGVEMARESIVREVRGVFESYSIAVDDRHLELIADYMTFEGGFRPFNRKGISTNSSPLLKASFETTASFISDAALYGDFDDLTSPTSNIVLGRPSKGGTGSFDVIMPIVA